MQVGRKEVDERVLHYALGANPDDKEAITGYRPSQLRQLVGDEMVARFNASRDILTDFIYYQYDVVLLAGMALASAHRKLEILNKGAITDFRYDRDDYNVLTRDAISNLKFSGLTGDVQMEDNGDRQVGLDVKQWRKGEQWVTVGHFPFGARDVAWTNTLVFATEDGRPPVDVYRPNFFDSVSNLVLVIVFGSVLAFGPVILLVSYFYVK